MTKGKARYSLSAAELAEHVTELGETTGPELIPYAVEDFPDKLDVSRVVKCDRFITMAMKAAGENGFTSFPKSLMKDALDISFEKLSEKWQLKDQSKWVAVMGKRWTSVMRFVGQALEKTPPSKWLQLLTPWKKKEPADATTDAESSKALGVKSKDDGLEKKGDGAESEETKLYFFGYDRFHRRAWRQKIKIPPQKRDHPKEHAEQFLEPGPFAQDTDPLVAKWPDGMTKAIPNFTVGDNKATPEKRTGSKAVDPQRAQFKWEAMHARTKNKISVALRPDRDLLCSLYEQSKQRLQVRVDTWGPDENDESTQRAAFQFMKQIAESYVKDEFPLSRMKIQRNLKLKKLKDEWKKGGKKQGRPRKRPKGQSQRQRKAKKPMQTSPPASAGR